MSEGRRGPDRGPGRVACRFGAAVAVLVVLSGCSDRMLDAGAFSYVIGNGPPPDEPTPIRSMTGVETAYPNLSTVPPRPTDIPSLEQRQSDMQALERSRAANRNAAQTVREDPRLPVEPLPVPPPPKVTPGRS